MKQLMVILFALAAITVSAQEKENIMIRGYIYDNDSKQPLSMAAAQIANSQLGALSDDNGYFEFPIPKINLSDSLRATFVGYTPQSISIKDYKAGDTVRLYLGSSIATKQEVVIVAVNARGVLLKAIENLRKNLFRDSLISTGLYRQFHKENGKYVRLIEADASVLFNCRSALNYAFHELIQINKQRRSENYERNKDANNHGDHFVELLQENPFSYNRGTFLNPKMIDFFSPKIEHEDSLGYIIHTQYKERSSKKLEQARIWIEKETYAITRIEVEKYPNPYYVPTRYEVESDWKLVTETDVTELVKRDGKFFVSGLHRTYNHHVINHETGDVQYIVEESFDLYFDHFQTTNVGATIDNGKFLSQTNLYSSIYTYEPNFWKNYAPVKEHPLPDGFMKDIEHAKPLEEQFVKLVRQGN